MRTFMILALFLSSCQLASEAPEVPADQIQQIQVVQLSWRSGELPVGHPVAGAWKAGDTVIMKAVIRTDFAGTFEWWGEGVSTWPVEREPDWWAPLPRAVQ